VSVSSHANQKSSV